MEAPRWPGGALIHERIRCVCRTENVLVYPDLWYAHQATEDVESSCTSCGRSLLPQLLPVGISPRLFELNAVPEVLLSALDDDLANEVRELSDRRPVELDGGDWDVPHPAPEAYVKWLESRPKPKQKATGIGWILLLVGLLSGLTWWVVRQ